MSTRSTTHFIYEDGTAEAIVYRHTDGYPSGAGADLLDFIKRPDVVSRIGDPSYLAARYVVFLADKFGGSAQNLDFLSVGICSQDPTDIQYRYTVDCEGVVRCYEVSCSYPDNIWTQKEIDLEKYLKGEGTDDDGTVL